MKKKQIFRGAATAMITPMDEEGRIRFPVFKKLLEMQIEQQADAVVVAGTTGEASTLTDEEHLELVEFAVKAADGRIPVIAGAGSNNTAHAVYMSKECEKLGADGLLLVTPYYNKTSQQGLYLHYKECAEAVSLPIILYNVPSRTGVNILPQTYQRLAEIDNITACKEAGGNFSQIAATAALCGDNLAIYSGNDDQITAVLALGGQGVISVLANILPAETHEICEAYFRGEEKRSRELQLYYMELIKALFSDVNPIPVKEAMRKIGYEVGNCRLPLCDMEDSVKEKLYRVLERYGFFDEMIRGAAVSETVQAAVAGGME